MNRRTATRLIAGAVLLAVMPPVPGADAVEYNAIYQASANGISASAERRLQYRQDGSFRLSNSVRAELAGVEIASLEQHSRFRIDNNTLVAIDYRYELRGLGAESSAIDYDWEQASAHSRQGDDSWQIPLEAGVMDPLSHQFALRRQIAAGITESLVFPVVDEDAIELHRYRVVGEEVLNTAAGYLDCVVVERVRDASDRRQTRFWLARDWQFVPVRIEQVQASGVNLELELLSAMVDGAGVRGRPEP